MNKNMIEVDVVVTSFQDYPDRKIKCLEIKDTKGNERTCTIHDGSNAYTLDKSCIGKEYKMILQRDGIQIKVIDAEPKEVDLMVKEEKIVLNNSTEDKTAAKVKFKFIEPAAFGRALNKAEDFLLQTMISKNNINKEEFMRERIVLAKEMVMADAQALQEIREELKDA